jgi:3-methyladenine DNA glycosylase AlkD
MSTILQKIHIELKNLSTQKRKEGCQRFFKTGKGEYAEGDIFLGATSPDSRSLFSKYKKDLKLSDAKKLLQSRYHEERFIALISLEYLYKSTKNKENKKEIFDIYIDNVGFKKGINNWDLIDISAYKIVGDYIYTYLNKKELKEFTDRCIEDKDLWIRRMIVVASFFKIRDHSNVEIFYIAKKLLTDKHHLIHKALGWMLRESGKKCSELDLIKFIRDNRESMSGVTYSYAMEKLKKMI